MISVVSSKLIGVRNSLPDDFFFFVAVFSVTNLDYDLVTWLRIELRLEQFEERLEECLLVWNWITKRNNKIFVIS